jgi:hypothetical protein
MPAAGLCRETCLGLVPADGIYAWREVNGRKVPSYLRLRDAGVAETGGAVPGNKGRALVFHVPRNLPARC